jgi:hypothetical protein
MSGGQSLVELAATAPVVMLLAVGAAATVQLADAQAGLRAATQAAVATAARAPNPAAGEIAARERFAAVIAAYPVRARVLRISFGAFQRGGEVVASTSGSVAVGWARLVFPDGALVLHATSVARLEPWRTHSP